MAEQLNFDNLTSAEVKNLWQKTREAALKQHGLQQAQVQARADLCLDGEFHRDQFGNMIEGKKPPAKATRYYTDDRGYAQELGPDEKAPVAQGNLLERVTKFTNENRTDPDVAALLPPDESVFEVTLESGWFLRGDVNTSGVWNVIAMHDGHENLKFSLTDDLTREEAIQSASHHIRMVTDPEPRDLTATELRRIAIQAANATNVPGIGDAVVEYLKLATKDDSVTYAYLERPDQRNVIIAAIYFCWKNSPLAKGFVENDDVLGHINAYLDSRDFVTIQTFIDAWDDFKNHRDRGLGGWRLEQPEPQPITEAEMNQLSDEDLAANLEEARKLVRDERNRA